MGKPFRNNVGISLFNASGRVLLARRFANDGPEIVEPGFEWQMPQGGIDEGEEAFAAARRELFEETGVTSAQVLGETDWMTYDFPPYAGSPDHRLAKYKSGLPFALAAPITKLMSPRCATASSRNSITGAGSG
jgi:putative (di)nucleoside polyphosphate hydrolase